MEFYCYSVTCHQTIITLERRDVKKNLFLTWIWIHFIIIYGKSCVDDVVCCIFSFSIGLITLGTVCLIGLLFILFIFCSIVLIFLLLRTIFHTIFVIGSTCKVQSNSFEIVSSGCKAVSNHPQNTVKLKYCNIIPFFKCSPPSFHEHLIIDNRKQL